MANDPKKKPKGEPGASIQDGMTASQQKSMELRDKINAGFHGSRGWVQSSYDQQLKDLRVSAGLGGQSADYYKGVTDEIRLLEKKISGIAESKTQKEKGSESYSARPQQKKKQASITGNQGIIGSMMNLGSNKLLGGN